MEPFIIVSVIVAFIVLLLLTGASSKPLKFIGSLFAKVVIGGMMLFLLNAFGSSFGLHVPINAFTAGVAGILGIPGVLSLAAIQYWII
ncbi:pro-sigmaK processing inhibitor BofA family protein [Bacillus sp. AGMB 02131]|uniref:Pro-sigmaK processing inhibitor BofA family protein n=1 Tax=Peribacillus faecalis TaxID=2772559 RepID=A0A927CYH0_9BACI|nr:pro-sigmaK processing inhibitor BofA family protein [Peribacillus faecalis]MBD3110043.1 pro-sigmaK processing inhibitor BofA family protein [Peribacillus faecalis]